MNIDPKVIDILFYIACAVIAALIALLVWLAKSVITKIDKISDASGDVINALTELKTNQKNLTAEINEMKISLKEIPALQMQLTKAETIIDMLKTQVSDYNKLALNNNEELSKLKSEIIKNLIKGN